MKVILFSLLTVITTIPSHALEPVRIEPGASYRGYSNDDLRRRVWQLERAVAQLQAQVFQLAVSGTPSAAAPNPWTCQIQSFGSTHVASGSTRASALALTLKKCSDATNAVHCKESEVKCDNQ